MSCRDFWHARVEATPGRPFLRYEGRTWRYDEFDDAMRRVAGGLVALGVGRGTVVAVGLTNRPEAFLTQLALHELGAVGVPLLPGLTFGELEYPLAHSEATVLVVDELVGAELLPRLDRFPLVERVVACDGLGGIPFEEVAAGPRVEHRPLAAYDERSLALVLYTSGSTGKPKGVMIGAGSLRSVGEAFSERYGITAADNWFQPTPVAHAIGALTGLGITTYTGCVMTLVDRFSPRAFWAQVNGNGATSGVLFPAHLNLLLEADDGSVAAGESSLRLVVTHAYIRRFRERFGIPLATVWGMTETGAICAGSEPGYEGELGENYVGTAMTGSEIGIFDDDFRPLPPGEPGEIALRHPHVMLGYLRQPEETARTLVDGWVRSGDRGVMDEDGRVFFAGRFKNVIKRSGESVSAEEVELALADHPDVSECAVFGVPDPIRAEEVAAVVVVRPGASFAPAELRAACSAKLVRWKLPRYLLLRDEPLPRLGNGKVDRVQLVESFEIAAAWDADQAAAKTTTPSSS